VVFGFKSKNKNGFNALSEEDIRNRLYGSAVGTSLDTKDKPKRSKNEHPKETVPVNRHQEYEKAKIQAELNLLRRELEQTKRRLVRMRGVKAKKIRLLALALLVLLVASLITTFAVRKIFFSKVSAVQSSPKASKGNYSIQVAVYQDLADAERFSSGLNSKGYLSFIHKSYYTSGKEKFVVYVGSFKDKRSAEGMLNKLRIKEDITDSYIAPMPK
jgi:hypothetical protein